MFSASGVHHVEGFRVQGSRYGCRKTQPIAGLEPRALAGQICWLSGELLRGMSWQPGLGLKTEARVRIGLVA